MLKMFQLNPSGPPALLFPCTVSLIVALVNWRMP